MNTGRPETQPPHSSESSANTEAIDYLYNRINFEKSQDQPYNQQNFRLSRMERLLVQIGNPQQSSPVIHIAGSKGKGSVAWLTAEILRRSGYRTGLYTSPHLVSLEERFVIDGKSIHPSDLVRAIQAIAPAVDEIARLGHGQATFFEITTSIAWWLFRESKCDVVVVEVGLGGRLDSTNVCWPTLSIITSISYDHQLQLGNSLAEIAAEKAGIIKPGVPVISGVLPDEPREVIHRIAKERGCQLRQAGRDFFCNPSTAQSIDAVPNDNRIRYGSRIDYSASKQFWSTGTKHEHVALRMLGEHQIANSGLVLASVDLLREQGWTIPNHSIYQALAETQVPGRIQVVSESPLIILDTAHNEASVAALITAIGTHFADKKLKFVFAASKDKKYRLMLEQLMEVATEIVVTQFEHNPRTVSAEELAALIPILVQEKNSATLPLKALCSSHKAFRSPKEAMTYSLANLKAHELVCITGSFFLAAELIPWLRACNIPNVYMHSC